MLIEVIPAQSNQISDDEPEEETADPEEGLQYLRLNFKWAIFHDDTTPAQFKCQLSATTPSLNWQSNFVRAEFKNPKWRKQYINVMKN